MKRAPRSKPIRIPNQEEQAALMAEYLDSVTYVMTPFDMDNPPPLTEDDIPASEWS